jgi:hypothetical protein
MVEYQSSTLPYPTFFVPSSFVCAYLGRQQSIVAPQMGIMHKTKNLLLLRGALACDRTCDLNAKLTVNDRHATGSVRQPLHRTRTDGELGTEKATGLWYT